MKGKEFSFCFSKALVKRIQHFTEQRTTLLCLAQCCSAQCGQTNTTSLPIFLAFRDLYDVNRRPALVLKLILGVLFRIYVKLSLRESSKLDRVVKRIRHFTEQRTEDLKQEKCLIVLPTFFITIKQRRAAQSSTKHSTTSSDVAMGPAGHAEQDQKVTNISFS